MTDGTYKTEKFRRFFFKRFYIYISRRTEKPKGLMHLRGQLPESKGEKSQSYLSLKVVTFGGGSQGNKYSDLTLLSPSDFQPNPKLEGIEAQLL